MADAQIAISPYEATFEIKPPSALCGDVAIDAALLSTSPPIPLTGVVIIAGPEGKEGQRGQEGPPGAAEAFLHDQMMPSALWTVKHGWATQPSVSVTDGGSSEVICDVEHPSQGVTIIKFAHPVIGRARLI